MLISPSLEGRYAETKRSEDNTEWPTPTTEYSETSSILHHHDARYQKICAKLNSGTRFGIGFVLERACGPECNECEGNAFERHCRLFDFRPHYDVKLEKKPVRPVLKVCARKMYQNPFTKLCVVVTR